MTDIERAAFEEWTVNARGALDLSRKLDGTYRVASRNVELMVWQARASRPAVVTDESATHAMLTAGGRAIGNTMRWANHYERAAEVWRAMIAAWRDPENLPGIPSAALNGGT